MKEAQLELFIELWDVYDDSNNRLQIAEDFFAKGYSNGYDDGYSDGYNDVVKSLQKC